MVAVYVIAVLFIILKNVDQVIPSFQLILEDAFTGNAVLGGSLGTIIIAGARRAAFSNEAGIGTAPIAHGAAKTDEPVREGLVAMLGPFIDTIIVCTLTALTIISTGQWQKRIDLDKKPLIVLQQISDESGPKLVIQAKEQETAKLLASSWEGESIDYDLTQNADSIVLLINNKEISKMSSG